MSEERKVRREGTDRVCQNPQDVCGFETRVCKTTILTAGAGPLHSKWHELAQEHFLDILFLFFA